KQTAQFLTVQDSAPLPDSQHNIPPECTGTNPEPVRQGIRTEHARVDPVQWLLGLQLDPALTPSRFLQVPGDGGRRAAALDRGPVCRLHTAQEIPGGEDPGPRSTKLRVDLWTARGRARPYVP